MQKFKKICSCGTEHLITLQDNGRVWETTAVEYKGHTDMGHWYDCLKCGTTGILDEPKTNDKD